MGTPAEDAGRDEDVRRAQLVLNTQENVVLRDRDASASLPELVAQIIAQNPGLEHRTPDRPIGLSDAEAPDIFFSYAGKRRASVLPIKDTLVGEGYSVFYDFDSIRGGDEFADVIDARLKKSRVVVACWSHESFTSRWCKNEWRVGLFRGTLVPVAIDRIALDEIPTEFNGLQYIDFSTFSGDPREHCFQNLTQAVRRLMERDAR